MCRRIARYRPWPIAFVLSVQIATVAAETELNVAEQSIEQSVDRPRIGLVLGGGGARGAAHIGVLHELERLRVPIDAIVGTSMGAIVGGLYAAGMSVAELEEIATTLDWADAMSDKPRREDLSFRRKQDDEQFPIDIGVGLRGGDLLLPKGLVQGQKLGLLLRQLTIGVSHIDDFDNLDIPFRAVATDLESGEKVVLRSGDLALSISASMSVPAIFAPVEIDGRLLVDGGLVGNLPIDVMQQMDVDIIIAVDVEFPLYDEEELQSVLTISEQVLTILMHRETLRQIALLGEQDVLIRPKLGLFGSTDFVKIAQAIEPGVQATSEVASQLEESSVDGETFARYLENRTSPTQVDEQLAFVRVSHDDRIRPGILESRLDTKVGDTVDPNKLAEDANKLLGLKLYEEVSYKLFEEDGGIGVEFLAEPTSLGPNYLQFGVTLESDLEGATTFNLSARLTRTAINTLGAEWRTDLQLGTDPRLFSEFYQPLTVSSRWFVAPRIELHQYNLNAYVLDDNVARYRVSEAELGLDIGTELGRSAEFRVGMFTGTGKAAVEVGDPSLPKIEFDTGGVLARIQYDSFDNAWFPRRGVRADATWTLSRPGLGADQSFETIESSVSAAWSRGKSSLQLGIAYASNSTSDVEVQNYFPLGGFLRLSGLERGQISGPHAALARLVYYRRIGSSAGGVFEVPVFLGASIEAGNAWQTQSAMSFGSTQMNGSLFIALDSFVGPIYLAGGIAEGGDKNIYFNIGARPR
jgi:NTE family protein